MLESAVKMIKKHREALLYLIFGGLTTLVNFVVYLFLAAAFKNTVVPTAIAWFVSVLFAYVTNKIWVFSSRSRGRALVRELFSFVAARVFSGVLDVGVMAVFADLLGFNDKLVKIASNVLVIALNYLFSKLFIFKKP